MLPNFTKCKHSSSAHPTILWSSQTEPQVQGNFGSKDILGNQFEQSVANVLLMSERTWVHTWNKYIQGGSLQRLEFWIGIS